MLFDLDGVLVDSEAVIAQVWRAALADEGLDIGTDEISRHFTGQQFPAVLSYLAGAHAFEPIPGFLGGVEERFNAAMGRVPAIEGAAQTLQWLRARGVPLAVASNSERGRLHLKLASGGLRELVGEHAYDPSWVGGVGKPRPELYQFAAARLGADPRACLVVEDSVAGAAAGLAAGAEVWGLSVPGHPHPDPVGALRAVGVTRVFRTHAELRAGLAGSVPGAPCG